MGPGDRQATILGVRRFLATLGLVITGLAGAACVTVSDADPRRGGRLFYPEPIPASGWPGVVPTARSSLSWIEPAADRTSGLLVFLEGEGGGGAGQDAVLARFAARGYRILRQSVDALVSPPLRIEIDRPAAIDAAAARLAAVMDDRLASVAYAVEQALAQLSIDQPDVPQRPLIVGGIGLGACLVPTVSARLAGTVDAAILVGGGASLFEVVQSGSLETDGVEISSVALTPAQREFFGDLYLSESRLDPYHTARFLGGTPVLEVQARFDEVVPHWAGDTLHARLGSPKRLRVLGDHEDLLDELEDRADWIVDWVDEAVAR